MKTSDISLWMLFDEVKERTKDKDPYTAFCLAYYLARENEDLAGLMAKAIFWEKMEEK